MHRTDVNRLSRVPGARTAAACAAVSLLALALPGGQPSARSSEPEGLVAAVEAGPSANASGTVSWVRHAIPTYVAGAAAELSRTLDGATGYLHVVVANEEDAWLIGDAVVDGSVYYRTRNEGARWRDELRIKGIDPRLATSGRHVYIAVTAWDCNGGLGVLRNGDHGRRAAWSPMSCLTRKEYTFGYTSIAASRRFVYVASANEVSGRIAVRISRDHGRTWERVGLGWAVDEFGDPGGPIVVVTSGRRVAVAWTTKGVTRVRVSIDAGRHWRPVRTLASGDVMNASGSGGRLAVDGAAGGTPWIRTWSAGGGWGRAVTPPARGIISLKPDGRIAAAYCETDPTTGRQATAWAIWDVVSRSWGPPEPVAARCPDNFLWLTGGHVYVIDDNGDRYRLNVRVPPA